MSATKKIIMSLLLCSLAFVTVGCSCGQQVKVENVVWEQPYIEMVVGDVYDLNATILPSNASNQALFYSDDGALEEGSRNNYVLSRVDSDTIRGDFPGVAVVTATSRQDSSKKADITVRVYEKEITLDAPSGLLYNTITKRVEWQPVTYAIGSRQFAPVGYIVNVNGVDGELSSNTYYESLLIGEENTIKVRAVAESEVIHNSEYSSSIEVTRLNTPKNLVRQGNTLTWDEVEDASTYTIRVNNEVFKTGITTTTTEIDFDVAGNYAVTVEAVPDVASDTTLYSSLASDIISIVKLTTIQELSLTDNTISWNEVAGAVSYNVVFEKEDEVVATVNSGVNTFLALDGLTQIPAGEIVASVIAVNNTSSGFDSENAEEIEFTKLGTPNNLQIVDNALTFSQSLTAVSYSIDVNGEIFSIAMSNPKYSLPADAPSGEYLIKMRAIGDGNNIISSDWTSDEAVYEAVKLEKPTEVEHSNNTIIVDTQNGIGGYEVKDIVEDINKIYTATEYTTNEQKDSFVINFEDKATQMKDLLKNHYKVVVKAKGTNGQNYFDSDYSEVSTEFYKLIPPVEFQYTMMGESYQYSWRLYSGSIDLATNIILSKASKGVRPNENMINIPYFHYRLAFSDKDGNELYSRLVNVEENESLSPGELAGIGGGSIFISLALVGNDNEVIDSSFCESIEGRRMYEPQNLVVEQNSIKWTTEGDYEDSLYHIFLRQGEDEVELGASTTKSFTFEDLLINEEAFEMVNGIDYELVFITTGENQENSPYYKSRQSEITITRLATPEVTRNGNMFVWDEVENALSYEVWIDEVKVEEPIFEIEDGEVSWLCTSGGGEHGIQVYAINDGENNTCLKSFASESVVYNRLAIQNVTISNNIISWEQQVEGATYFIKVTNVADDEFIKEVETTDLTYDLRTLLLIGGTYNINIVAKASGYVDSLPSETKGFVVLNAPIIIYNDEQATNSIITWEAVPNSKGYVLRISYGTSSSYETDLITDLSYDLSANAVVGGVLTKITISAIGIDDRYIDSIFFDIENPFNFTKLATPSGLDGTMGESKYTLTWSAIEGANYEVYLDGEKVEDVDTNSYEFDAETFAEVGEYVLNVRAVSADDTKPQSSLSDSYTITKYTATVGLTVANNKLTWQNIAGATYNVKISNDDEAVVDTNIVGGEYDLSALNSGTYNVSVSTEGNDKTTLSGDASVINGIIVLQGTEGLTFDVGNRRLTWTSIENDYGYVLIYTKGSTIVKQAVEINNYTIISDEVTAGEWSVVVKVKGNNTNIIDSPNSNSITFTRLESVTGLTFDKGLLTFNQVGEHNSYKIITNTQSQIVTYQQGGYTLEFIEAGDYNISVVTMGDFVTTTDSLPSVCEAVKKLAKVQNLALANNTLTWSAVTDADSYLVKIGANEHSITNTTFDLTTLNLDKGEYAVSVKAISEDKYIINSDEQALASNITVLGAVTNIAIEQNENITFNISNVGDASGYIIRYTKGQSIINNEFSVEQAKKIDLTLVAGDYSLCVISKGNNQYIINSKPSTEITFTKPATPKPVTHKSKLITVTKVGEYKNYLLKIVHNQNTEIINLNNVLTTIYPFTEVGEYSISVAVAGNSTEYINSSYSETIKVTRLDKVNGLTIRDNTIHFEANTLSTTNNFDYEIVFDNGTNQYTATTKNNQLSFINEEWEQGIYSISVRCLAGEEIGFLPSETQSITNITKLVTPTLNANLINNKITWTNAIENVVGYEVKVVGDTEQIITINDVNVKEVELGDSFESGEYTISVRAVGNGTSVIKSNYSNEIVVTKLNAPEVSIVKSNDSSLKYRLTWSEIIHATGYKVYVNNLEPITTVDNFVVLDDLAFVDEENNPISLVGTNSIKVLAIGDNTIYANSKQSNEASFVVGDINTTNLHISAGVLVWDDITIDAPNAQQLLDKVTYQLIIDGVAVWINNAENTYMVGPEFNSQQIYQIKIKAFFDTNGGVNNVYINTEKSNAIEAPKLTRPAKATLSNGFVTINISGVSFVNLPEENEEEGLLNIRQFEVVYGNNTSIFDFRVGDINYFSEHITSGRPGLESQLKYRVLGDDNNLTSDWSEVNNVTELEYTQIWMENGILHWTAVPNATSYYIEGRYMIENQETNEIETVKVSTRTNAISIEKPFYEDIKDISGNVQVLIGLAPEGNQYFSNGRAASLSVTYLGKPYNFATEKGALKWEGGLDTFEVTIDGNQKSINTNTYEFAGEESGKHNIKIKAKGNNQDIVDSVYSELQTIFKIDTPNKDNLDTYIENGTLRWQINKGFLFGYSGDEPNLTKTRIESYFTGDTETDTSEYTEEQLLEYEKRLYKTFTLDDVEMYEDNLLYSQLHALEYMDYLTEGTYKLKICTQGNSVKLSEGTGFITSNYSQEFNVNVLPYPLDVVIEDGVLSWSRVESCTGYLVEIVKVSDKTVFTHDLPNTVSTLNLNELDLVPSEYNIVVRAKGDDSYNLTSRPSKTVTTTRLASPKAENVPFTIIDGKIAWGEITGAETYDVEVVRVENNETTTYNAVETEKIDDMVLYRLSDTLNSGEYKLRIKSIGDGSNFIDSIYGEFGFVTKVDTITQISNQTGKLKWEVVNLSAQSRVNKYEIDFIGSIEDNNYNYIIDVNTDGFTIDDGYCYYELHREIIADVYQISIRAVGEVVEVGEGAGLQLVYYASSNPSQIITATRLASPSEIMVENGKVRWVYDGPKGEGYYIVVNDVTYTDYLTVNNESEFPDELASGEYRVNIKVVGNTIEPNSVGTRLLTSSVIGNTIIVNKLQEITDIHIDEGIVYFNEIENATEYEIIVKYGTNTITTTSSSYDSEKGMYYLELLGYDFPAGEYEYIKVRAIGSNYFVNSKFKTMNYVLGGTDYNKFYKLNTPQQVAITTVGEGDNKSIYLRWQQVQYIFNYNTYPTNQYKLHVEGELYSSNKIIDDESLEIDTSIAGTVIYKTKLNSLLSELQTGTYLINLQAIPQSIINTTYNAVASDFTENIQITRPDSPSGLYFDASECAFKWTKPTLNEGIEVKYELLYTYQESISSPIQVKRLIVNDNYYQPTALGNYNVCVRSIVSNSLASAYIGIQEQVPYLQIRYEDSTELQEFYNFDDLNIEVKNNETVYKINGETVYIIALMNSAVGDHYLFQGGDGSAVNPYKISTVEQLARINLYSKGFFFEQVKNINMQDAIFMGIGSTSKPFSGTYDGGGYYISNFKLSNSENIGLFKTTHNATIENVNIANVKLTINNTSKTNVGILVGQAINTTINDCTIDSTCSIDLKYVGSTAVTYFAGGLIGTMSGTIDLNGNTTAGSCKINNCINRANIKRADNTYSLVCYVGGLVGQIYSNTNDTSGIFECGNYGDIRGTISGGLAGRADSRIVRSYNYGAIIALYSNNRESVAGGIVGLYGQVDKSVVYQAVNCYNKGAVLATANINSKSTAGGFAGVGRCIIEGYFNAGSISAVAQDGVNNPQNQLIGWLVGDQNDTIQFNKVYNIIETVTKHIGDSTQLGPTPVTLNYLISNLSTALGDAFTVNSNGMIILEIES